MTPITTCQYLGHTNKVCGAATQAGSSYCPEHHAMVYQKGSARARRKKDERIAAAVWDIAAELQAAAEELIAEGYDFAEPLWEVKEVDEATT
jgi:hypothetical protein